VAPDATPNATGIVDVNLPPSFSFMPPPGFSVAKNNAQVRNIDFFSLYFERFVVLTPDTEKSSVEIAFGLELVPKSTRCDTRTTSIDSQSFQDGGNEACLFRYDGQTDDNFRAVVIITKRRDLDVRVMCAGRNVNLSVIEDTCRTFAASLQAPVPSRSLKVEGDSVKARVGEPLPALASAPR
jgi:hypothetical protein